MTLLVILFSCAVLASLAAIVHHFVRVRVGSGVFTEHNDVTAAVYATFGVLYAIILGLLVSHGQTRRDAVSVSSVRESALLVDIAQTAKVFGPGTADSLRKACIAYAEHVKSTEWASGNKQLPHERHVHFGQLWNIVRRIQPVGAQQEAVYRSILNLLEYIASERYERLAAAGDHMSPFLKLVLLVGAGITVVFLWFFGMQNNRLHLTYTWLVTLMLCLVLVLIFALDDPLRAGVGVEPDAYDTALEELHLLGSD